jgi:hypothetical protein
MTRGFWVFNLAEPPEFDLYWIDSQKIGGWY